MMAVSQSDLGLVKGCQKTKKALIWINILNEPLCALYSLLPFILVKDLKASPLQISIFVSLRPLLSLFSFYWGPSSRDCPSKLVRNVIGACFLTYVPFVIFSLFGNIWFILLSSAAYQLFYRAGLPAWIEILRRNIPSKPREDAFSFSYLLSFIESGILGLLVGWALDINPQFFRLLLFGAALLGLCGLFFLKGISQPNIEKVVLKRRGKSFLEPLKESYSLLKKRPDFKFFQIAFIFGGSALMLMAPALPIFYASSLNLTHSTITKARFIFMALGVIASSSIWKRLLRSKNINQLSRWILLGFGIFPILLLFAQFSGVLLYAAFFFYGISQAGSHLVWNLSGAIFSQHENSSPFTRINILMVGCRGLIFPVMGGLLCQRLGQHSVIICGMMISFAGYFCCQKLAMHKHAPPKS